MSLSKFCLVPKNILIGILLGILFTLIWVVICEKNTNLFLAGLNVLATTCAVIVTFFAAIAADRSNKLQKALVTKKREIKLLNALIEIHKRNKAVFENPSEVSDERFMEAFSIHDQTEININITQLKENLEISKRLESFSWDQVKENLSEKIRCLESIESDIL